MRVLSWTLAFLCLYGCFVWNPTERNRTERRQPGLNFVKDACAWRLSHIFRLQEFNGLVQIWRHPGVSEPPLWTFHAKISFIYTANLAQLSDKSRLTGIMNHFWSPWFPVCLPLVNSTVRYQCCAAGRHSFGFVFPLSILIARSESKLYYDRRPVGLFWCQAPIWERNQIFSSFL
jgi:hypothetical protein